MENKKRNISDMITLFETLEKKVHCKNYKPELNPDNENGFYILCSKSILCSKASNSLKHIACVPYGEKERSKIYISMCDRCFGAIKGHKEHLKELLKEDLKDKTDRIIDFLDESHPEEWL